MLSDLLSREAIRPWGCGESTIRSLVMKSLWGNGLRQGWGKIGRVALAVLLAAALVPVLPASSFVQEAEALEGTTKYEDFFSIINYTGKPANITDNTLRVGSTFSRDHYDLLPGSATYWDSSSGFVSKKPVSLLNSWIVRVKGQASPPALNSDLKSTKVNVSLGFCTNGIPSLTNEKLWLWEYFSQITESAWQTELHLRNVETNEVYDTLHVASKDRPDIVLSYDAKTDIITFIVNNDRITGGNARSVFGNSSWLFIGGAVSWETKTGGDPHAPYNAQTAVTFQSMSLPNLTPEIRDVKVYRADGTEIGRDDVVEPGDRIRVECAVRNANTAASAGGFNEQYPMHVKLADEAAHPTRGLTPFADGSHPIQVNGSTVATSLNDNTIQGKNGVPVTLVGNNATTVSWWAEVSGAQGGAVTLSQQLLEDSFGGSVYSTVELVDERPLTPGDGTGSGEAGVAVFLFFPNFSSSFLICFLSGIYSLTVH